MLKVLVPLDIYSPEKDSSELEHFVRKTYVKKLLKYDLSLLPVSCITSKEKAMELYGECDGVLLVGGLDIDPSCYRQKPHDKLQKNIRSELDRFELYMVDKLLADKKPALGVCRGMQVLAIASGGSLHQHIADVGDLDMHNNPGMIYENIQNIPDHEVKLEKGSEVCKLLGKNTVMCNTGHHQAIDNPGRDLRIVGRTEDGIAEILEHRDSDCFCIGVQGHPEIPEESDLEPIFEAFADAVEKYSRKA